MEHRYRINQDELKCVYESAEMRMKEHPDFAEKYKKIIQNISFYKTEKEAINAAYKMKNNGCFCCQIWAKVDRDEEYFFIKDYYIVTDKNSIKQAAEYIGMCHIFTA